MFGPTPAMRNVAFTRLQAHNKLLLHNNRGCHITSEKIDSTEIENLGGETWSPIVAILHEGGVSLCEE